ncbi:MAG TPA: response regulator transcription factor [Amnibacterium sp.]|uniref:response regulator n=1 Tax=Amnibacterium sp. TaxID=1872496 RepID=UPI002F92C805
MTGPEPIRVLLVDAEPLQRSGWRLAIDSQADLEVVAEAGDGVQALALLRRTPVDVAVLDVRLPRMSGAQLAKKVAEDARVRLIQRSPVTRVVLVTAADLDHWERVGGELGVDAVLTKDVDPERLFAAIRDAAAVRRAG